MAKMNTYGQKHGATIVRPTPKSQKPPGSGNNGQKEPGKTGHQSPRPPPNQHVAKPSNRTSANKKVTGSRSGDLPMPENTVSERQRAVESQQESIEEHRTALAQKAQDLEKREMELSQMEKKVEAEQKRLESLKRELEQHERALSERDAELEAREQQKNAESEYEGEKQFASSLHDSQMEGVRDLIRRIADICNQCQDENLI